MKKYGGFIPGIRAGRPTAEYLDYVLTRVTLPGSLYLGLIALDPADRARRSIGANQNFPFGGTSILIIVGVGLETVKQIDSQLQQRHYEGLLVVALLELRLDLLDRLEPDADDDEDRRPAEREVRVGVDARPAR